MVANLTHLAKAHYSPGKRRLFTVILGLLLATPTLMAAPKVPVIKVHAADATRHFQPRKARVNAMLQAGLQHGVYPGFAWLKMACGIGGVYLDDGHFGRCHQCRSGKQEPQDYRE